ncbi:MAG TPA: hypothetical protein VFU49_15815 [Ktedonobacteraceae bacterium]|nr:hypothetical protein [Ktedonobacteraceae bacterium]
MLYVKPSDKLVEANVTNEGSSPAVEGFGAVPTQNGSPAKGKSPAGAGYSSRLESVGLPSPFSVMGKNQGDLHRNRFIT